MAQTNIQLFKQLIVWHGYSPAELDVVRRAAALGLTMYDRRHRRTGKSYLQHGFGVASILPRLNMRLPAAAVCAAVIHSAFVFGGLYLDEERTLFNTQSYSDDTLLWQRRLVRNYTSTECERWAAAHSALATPASTARVPSLSLSAMCGVIPTFQATTGTRSRLLVQPSRHATPHGCASGTLRRFALCTTL